MGKYELLFASIVTRISIYMFVLSYRLVDSLTSSNLLQEFFLLTFKIKKYPQFINEEHLVHCSIGALAQLHVFTEVSCGTSQFTVREDSGLHIELLKSFTPLPPQ